MMCLLDHKDFLQFRDFPGCGGFVNCGVAYGADTDNHNPGFGLEFYINLIFPACARFFAFETVKFMGAALDFSFFLAVVEKFPQIVSQNKVRLSVVDSRQTRLIPFLNGSFVDMKQGCDVLGGISHRSFDELGVKCSFLARHIFL